MERRCLVLLLAAAPVALAAVSAPPLPSCARVRRRARAALRLPALQRLRGGVHTLADGEWEALHEEAGQKLVVVDFTAEWCGPCQRIAPTVEALAEEYGDEVVFVKVDVDELAGLAAELGVTSMPTFLFFRDGDLIHSIRGADEVALREQVAAHA